MGENMSYNIKSPLDTFAKLRVKKECSIKIAGVGSLCLSLKILVDDCQNSSS